MTQSETAARLASEKYPIPKNADYFSPYYQDQVSYCSAQQEAFIQGYTHDRWVSVETKLPEPNENVLVYCSNEQWYKGHLDKNEAIWFIETDDNTYTIESNIRTVTHFQYIEPPKPQGE